MKSANKLISIGMPVYNGEKNLKEAITSILSQSYKNLELIIADDSSTDRSREIYEQFAKKDKRIKIFRHKKNIGSILNFNFVLEKARGKYFMWAAQDDIREQSALKELIRLHNEFPDAVLAVSHYKNLFNNKKYVVYPKATINNNQTIIISLANFLKSSNLSFFYGLHKTANLKKSGGYLRDSRPYFKSSDFLTIYKVLLNGKFVYTSKVLFYKRDTGLFTNQFEIIKNLRFDSLVFNKILRYLFFPLFYSYDFVYGTYYLSKSNFPYWEKIIIEWYLMKNTVSRFVGFFGSILKGIFYLTKGLLKKIFFL